MKCETCGCECGKGEIARAVPPNTLEWIPCPMCSDSPAAIRRCLERVIEVGAIQLLDLDIDYHADMLSCGNANAIVSIISYAVRSKDASEHPCKIALAIVNRVLAERKESKP